MTNKPVAAERSKARWHFAAALALLVLLWFRFLSTLVLDWEVDPQYAHGWFIPILAGILIATRWRSLPSPQPSPHRRWLFAGAIVSLLLLAPLAFLQAVYPEARPFQWLHGLLVGTVTFIALWLYGGKGWARHFAFPIFFVLLAVPWPRSFQNQVTNSLMNGVAATTVELTLLAGIPAHQQGNAIGLSDGVVGIDEACSGIRSLQGSMIIGLFLGSYFPLLPFARVVLLGLAVSASLLLNIVRATALTLISATSGAQALHRYHDPAGFLILVVVFILAVVAAKVLGRRWSEREKPPVAHFFWPRPATIGLAGFAGLAWLGLTNLGCRAYFGPAQRPPESAGWQLDLQRTAGRVTEMPLSPTARQFLRYDSAQASAIEHPDGTSVRLIDLEWRGGEISAAGARMHTPSICLPSIGYRLHESLPPVPLQVGGLDATFTAEIFDTGDRHAYVYHALWEDGRAVTPGAGTGDQSLRSAITAVLERRRLARARVLMLMFIGPEDAAQARAELQSFLEKVIVVPAA